jgi:acylphosphatase
MPELVRRRVRISGMVQGVYFRHSTRERARELGLAGWVRNRSEGSVEAAFQGPPEAVDEMIRWCHQGPPGSRVAAVEVIEEASDEPLAGFSIRRTE